MTFDDQLRRAFDTLTDRLHDEIARHVQMAIDELASSARQERDQSIADVHAERDRALADAQAQRDEAIANARAERDQSVAERDQAGAERDQAGAERDQAVAERDKAVAERDQAVADALERQSASPAPTEPAATGDDNAPARLLAAIREIDGGHTLSDTLDALVRCAAREADRAAVLLVREGGYTGWRSIGFDPPFDRGQPVELATEAAVMPIAIGGQAVAVLYAGTQNSDAERATQRSESDPNPALEILVRHAARCLESLTAFKAARSALASGAADASGAATDEASADEDAAARRYARLLVSEIRLYHESDVVAGRRAGDLASRLGGEIARARVLYEQRVPAQIRQRADYFHDELVRTLANGDPALLELRTYSSESGT